ncbi:MAG TPA: hypothetical protein VI564_03315 [Candidatus Nanoarchaeia archaeon]|nr:hypothetical protein [Candidatus Nanoarchaeia archaeon]
MTNKLNSKKLAFPLFMISLLLIFSLSVLSVPKSTTYNGKEYYVVTSTDASEDSGNEVCAKVGKTCAGFTAFSTDVCKKFHPDASVTTSVHGSKTGFYCNGPPQTGLACETSFNNCQICPACNVNVDCSESIGGLFREMYVECTGGEKEVKTYYDLIKELSNCPGCDTNNKIPDSAKSYVGTNLANIYVITPSSIDFFYATTLDGKIMSFGRGMYLTPTVKVSTSQQVIERLLQSNNKGDDIEAAINNGDILIQFVKSNTVLRLGVGFMKLFGSGSLNLQAPAITDSSGKDTSCNIKWDGPRQISCYGPFQASGTGYGQNCCELACGADSACDEQNPGALLLNGQCDDSCKLNSYRFIPLLQLPPPSNVVDARIGQHPGSVACEFYQTTLAGDAVKSNHKHVTCAAYKAADNYCVTVMQSQYAKAAKCEEQGIIVCTNPCVPPTYQLPIKQCAFEGERPRGSQAAPLTFCNGAYTGNVGPGNAVSEKKNPGEICKHGGECRSGFCVGDGPPYGLVYRCSCTMFSITYGC